MCVSVGIVEVVLATGLFMLGAASLLGVALMALIFVGVIE
jgi:hypothetical protein